MTVVENVQMALLSHHGEIFPMWGAAASAHRERALELLAQVGMADAADRALQASSPMATSSGSSLRSRSPTIRACC